MTSHDILQQRLVNQQLMGTVFTAAHQLVNYMGCIQAQDYAAAKWAIGMRIKALTDAAIEKDFNEGKILRTHVLRPTWHFVSPDDIGWMLQLTAPQIKRLTAGHHKKEGIDKTTLQKSRKVFEAALSGNIHLSREELIPLLKDQHIKTNDNHLSFLLLEAELDGLICSGARKGKQFTYTLLEERVPKLTLLDKDEGLAKLAYKYFTSRGPATVQDFAWWGGLKITDAKIGLELNKSLLAHEIVNGQIYWSAVNTETNKATNSVHLLPAYDEFAVAYKNRSHSLKQQYNQQAGNGIFKPTLLINRQVAGTWKRTEKTDKVLVETAPFAALNKQTEKGVNTVAKQYANFLGKTLLTN